MIIPKSAKIKVALSKFERKMSARKTMYEDDAWKNQRNAIARGQGYRCFNCNAKLKSEKYPSGRNWHQHHRHHSNGASAQCALCVSCHEKEHGREFAKRSHKG